MRKANSFNLDKLFILLSVLYLIAPIIIFLFSWIKTIYAIVLGIPFLLLTYYVYMQISETEIRLFTKENIFYWTISILVLGVWVYFSGIGSFTYQNEDFWVRNPIYRDLCNYKWPVIYDLSNESLFVQNITGTSKVAFSYYFTWWLVPALISKALHLSEIGCNIVLYLWALLGTLLVLYCINRLFKKCSFIHLFVFITFSGMDIIRYLYYGKEFHFIEHIEWWSDGFWLQYSSNTTQLYWVFNQSIPLWIITSLVIQCTNNRYIGSLCALSFVYSPWATLGIIPIAWAGSFFRKQNIKEAFNPINSVVTIITALVYGLFYMASSGSSGGIGTTISYYRNELIGFIIDYFIFIIIEVILYVILIRKENKDNIYFLVVIVELLLFPLIWMRDGNFTMRASIPALFILMFYVINTLEKTKNNVIKVALILIICIGSITPICEMNRSLVNTLNGNIDNEEEIYSFGDIKTDFIPKIEISRDQFFIYDYKDSLFFKYLAKEQ